jgi:hypothetical protein
MTITKMAATDQAKASSHDWRIGSAPGKHRGEEAAGDGVVRGMHQNDDQHAAPGVVEHPVEDDVLREINSAVNG